MPTAPTRIKLSPRTVGRNFAPYFLALLPHILLTPPFLGDVFALPVQLRPPEMGNEAGIGAVWRYWEGGFVLGGWKRRADLTFPALATGRASDVLALRTVIAEQTKRSRW